MQDEPRWGCEHGIEVGFRCDIAGGDVGVNGEPLVPLEDESEH